MARFNASRARGTPRATTRSSVSTNTSRPTWTITLADPFGLRKRAETLSQINWPTGSRWTATPRARRREGPARRRGIPIAMSRFGERVLRDEGCEPLFVPHGVDTEVFCLVTRAATGTPSPESPGHVRHRDLRDEPRRKPQGIRGAVPGVRPFHGHPDTFLAVHSTPGGGLNLNAMAARLGISAAVGFPDSYSYDLGLITGARLPGSTGSTCCPCAVTGRVSACRLSRLRRAASP